MSLSEIRKPVEEQMKRFEAYFRSQLDSPHVLLSLVTNHILRSQGKQMRPMLVFLAAKATGPTCEATFSAATLIELLHTATLVHDDVVDEAEERRGLPSVWKLWSGKIAVLVGDFFLARGLQVALEHNHYDVLRIVSSAVRDLSEGELQQLSHARNLDITEEAYYEVINKKTATLIRACTRAGACSSGASEEMVEALSSYGTNLGLAFQIRDDIADFERTNLFGKPTGADIGERKLTLPIIHALTKSPKDEAKTVLRAIKRRPKDGKTLKLALELIERYGGMDYAREKMQHYAQRAKDALSVVPESEAKQSLIALVDFNTMRNR